MSSASAIPPADDCERRQQLQPARAEEDAERQRLRILELEALVEEQRREIADLRARLVAFEGAGAGRGALATLAKVTEEASASASAEAEAGAGAGAGARRGAGASGGADAVAPSSKAEEESSSEGAYESAVEHQGETNDGRVDDDGEDAEVDGASKRKRRRRRTKAERSTTDAGDDEEEDDDDDEAGTSVGAAKKRSSVRRRQSPRRKLLATKKKLRAKAEKGGIIRSPTKRKTRSLPTRKAAQDAFVRSKVKDEVTGKRKRGRPRRSPAVPPKDEESPERDTVAEDEEEEDYDDGEDDGGDGFVRRRKKRGRKPGYVPFADIDPERKTEGMIKYEKKLEDNYNARLAELEQFKAEKGHCNVPQKYPPNKNLGRFVESLRRYYGRHQKGEHVPVLFVRNIDRLREMGFQLDRTRRSIGEANWEKRISQLKQFKEEHGHCIVPPSAHKKFPGLHNFVNNMRVQYRKLKEGQEKVAVLTPRRMAVLNDLGFVFNHRGNRTDRWDENYENLRKFKEEHGHTRVTDASDSFLAMWCQTQRVQYRNLMQNKEGKTMMSPDRIARLQLLGFEWNPLDARATYWEARFRDLLTYKAEHGDMRVPKIYKPNVKLSNWVYEQRKMYRKRREGDKAGIRMTDEKIRRLEEVGFEWTVVSYLRKGKKEHDREPQHQVETEEILGDDDEEEEADDEKRLQQQQEQEQYRAEQHQQLQQQQQQQQQHLQQQLHRHQVQELRMQALSEDQQQLQRQQVQQELRIQALREEQAHAYGLIEDQHPFGHRQHLTVPNEATLHPLPPAIPPHPQYKWP